MIAATTAQFKAEQAALRKEYLEIIARRGSVSDRWLQHYDKSAGHFARLSNGDIVVISKPSIQTRFYFGESGYDYDEARDAAARAARSEEYFKRENLSDFQRWIDILNGSFTSPRDVLVGGTTIPGVAAVAYCSPEFRPGFPSCEVISEADRAILLDAYRAAYAAFEKRLNAYLKRYGLSKVRTWTYWRDA